MTDRDLVRRDQVDKPANAPRGKNYLLGIAINEYQHCTKLSNAVRDVETFIELMCTRYHFERENVTFIKDGAATKKGIENAFLRLIKTITPQDNLIVYFSGHGRYDEHYGGNWVPVEAGIAEEDWPDYLSNDSIKGYLGRIKSLHTFLIADSCFSGALFAERGKDKNLGQRVDTEPSRWALTSGKKEIVSDGRAGEHSPFATALLDVLHKAIEPPSVMQICNLVLEKVAANVLQTPMGSAMMVSGHQGGQMVFYLREDEEAIWIATQATHSLQAYLAYRAQFPQGKYRRVANAKIADFEEQDVWDRVRKTRIADLLNYIDENPSSPFVPEAKSLVTELERGHVVRSDPPSSANVKPTLEVSPTKVERSSIIVPELMVFVKGGTFEMGDVMGDNERDNETVHTVTLSDFMIGKYAVTFEEYDAFCAATKKEKPGDMGWGRGQGPVINVNWFDAIEYCNWLSKEAGLEQVYKVSGKQVEPNWQADGYCLPTEAEWEYAARSGGKKVRFGNGKDIADSKEINFNGRKDCKEPYSITGEYREKTVPVGSLNSPNALGLHDMSGNILEWCWDWYDKDYYKSSPSTDPRGPNFGYYRVLRGGSWYFDPLYCRASVRGGNDPDNRISNIGFRLVRH